MKYVVTGKQMKMAEENYLSRGVSQSMLIENAGEACYKKIAEIVGGVEEKAFVVLCGRGNNGSDGIVLAHHLNKNGAAALCIFVSDLPNGIYSRECYTKYCNLGVSTSLYTHHEDTVNKAMLNCDVIVDAVFGTGFHGSLEPKTSNLFRFINNNCSALKISVDVPSGIDSDTGEISEGFFKPDVTLMLGAVKYAFLGHPCFENCGNLVLLDIGITSDCYREYKACLTENEVLGYLPKRNKNSNKGDYGRILNISGSERYMGAAVLSTKAMLKAGAGLVTLASPKQVCFSIAPAVPEAVLLPLYADEDGFADDESIDKIKPLLNNFSAVAIGSGLGITAETRELTEFVIKNAGCPIILDADGINIVAGNINVLKDNDKPKILTPHPLEFSRLTGINVSEIQTHRIRYARHYAKEWNSIIVLKGVNTVTAAPDGRIYVNTTGNAGLAKGGSGDVLTGIIASLAAQGVELFMAAVLGVYLHGSAADELSKSIALSGIMPSDIAEILPFVMKVK